MLKVHKEEWVEVSDCPGYEVSNMGRVRSWRGNRGPLKSPRILSVCKDKRGRYKVELRRDGKSTSKSLRSLVAHAFVPNPYDCQVIKHHDGNEMNVRFDNLYWADNTFNSSYTLDESVFDKVDSEECAYWIGFMAADGSVNPRGNTITLQLKYEDRDVIYKLRRFMKSDQKIKAIIDSAGRVHARLYVCSSRLKDALMKVGIHPQKHFTVAAFKYIPKNFLRHFWRGAIDGDGSLGIYPNKNRLGKVYPKPVIGMTGNEMMVTAFKDFILDSLGHLATVHNEKGKKTYRVTFNNRKAKDAAHFLYDDASVYMKRKKEMADSF